MSHEFQADIDAVNDVAAVASILNVVCATTGMGFAAVARVTESRWIACRVRDDIAFGLKPGDELKIETTICNEIRQTGDPVVIDHVAEDAVFRDHHTPAIYGFQSYISIPIMLPDGTFFGTLCAIDPRPARVSTPQIIGMFRLFAELIAFHLDAAKRIAVSEASLVSERETSELREQFIAVLGHDLRNPLAAIDGGVRLLLQTPLNDRATGIAGMMHKSVVRMSELIDNVLDFARARLGGGISLEREAGHELESTLTQVVAELRAAWPDRTIRENYALIQPVHCDPSRIGQLASNLLANALTYGAVDQPVRLSAMAQSDTFTLTIANAGEPIPAAVLERIFQPFARGPAGTNQEGLGLGLYIASEVARAHGGTLTATSTPEETRFTFRMPTN